MPKRSGRLWKPGVARAARWSRKPRGLASMKLMTRSARTDSTTSSSIRISRSSPSRVTRSVAGALHITESIRYSTSLARENETGRRTVREQSTVGVRDAAFRCANTTATVEDLALGPDRAGIQRDGADKRNLELERGAADAFVEHRMDC